MTKGQIRKMLGASLSVTTRKSTFKLFHNDDHLETFDVPEEFDARKEWPECISTIREQKNCGSCWAFSVSTTLSDRFCIASKGKLTPTLSPQYIVSCDKGDLACDGGELNTVWKFLEENGTTTDQCVPYISGDGKTVPKCSSNCAPVSNSSKTEERFVIYKAKKGSSKALTCPLQIQREIMENGPVQTGFEVYEDFLHYKTGIYHYADGDLMGGHAVKIVGWGKEKDVNYWIVANSWGPGWGENGYFRIKFGECYFDDNAYVGEPDVALLEKIIRK